MTLEWALITCNKFDRMEERQNDLCPGNSFNNKISHYFCSVGNVAADNGENAPAVKKTYSELIKMCHFYGFVFYVNLSISQLLNQPEIPQIDFLLSFSLSLFSFQTNARQIDAAEIHADTVENAYHPIRVPFACAHWDTVAICAKCDSIYRWKMRIDLFLFSRLRWFPSSKW